MASIDAQWKVLSVDGKLKANGVLVAQGNTINPDEAIVFSESGSRAILADKTGEIFILTQAEGIAKEGEIAANLIQKYKATNTRGFRKLGGGITDLKQFFGSARFTLLEDKTELPLDARIYPLNNDKFIVFYYEINGEKVSKKIGFDHQKLILEKDKLLQSPTQKLEGTEIRNLYVYQYEISSKATVFITKIHLNFEQSDKIAKELSVLKNWLTENSNTDIDKKLGLYFETVYGRTQSSQFLELLATIN